MSNPAGLERIALRMPLDELRHNVPVDREHVRRLARSIEKSGQLSPVLLWFRNKDIIDGFHRTEALRLVGATEAETNVIDCTPEEFRDARITSAVLHKGVSFPRVVMWTREVFEETQWASRLRGAEAFHLDRAAQYPKPYRRALRGGLAAEEIQDIRSWVRGKSATWGLNPEQIARMLDLADLIAPSLIPLVGPKPQEREAALTTTMLRSLAAAIPDHQVQEALVKKAMAEKLNEDEVHRLVIAFSNAQTPDEQQSVLSTSWLTVPKPKPTIVQITLEEQKRQEEQRRINSERFRIDMTRGVILEAAKALPTLPINNHPDMRPDLDAAINELLASIARYQGNDVDVVERLQEQVDQLTQRNKGLNRDNEILTRRLNALHNARSIANRIEDEEIRLRRD